MKKEYWFKAEYRPYVTINKKKHYTEDVSLLLPAKNKKSAMKQTIATLIGQGHKYAPLNAKYITLKKIGKVV